MQERGGHLAANNVLAGIRADLEPHIGSKVILKSNRGRNKIVEREGVLEQLYPNIFIVKLEERRVIRRISFNYSDLLTESIEITVCYDGEENFIIRCQK